MGYTQIKVYYAEISLSGNCLFLRFSVFRSCDYITLPKPYSSARLVPFFQALGFLCSALLTDTHISIRCNLAKPKLGQFQLSATSFASFLFYFAHRFLKFSQLIFSFNGNRNSSNSQLPNTASCVPTFKKPSLYSLQCRHWLWV